MPNRTATHVALAVSFVLVIVLGVISLSSRSASPESCTPFGDYGKQCEAVTASGATVTGIKAQLTWFPDVFDQHEWTFVTTTYRCDPRGRTKAECAPTHTTYGSAHAPTPHATAEVVCSRAGQQPTAVACSGNLGVKLPQTLAANTWVCTEFAVRVHGKWVDNGAGLSDGLRACRKIH